MEQKNNRTGYLVIWFSALLLAGMLSMAACGSSENRSESSPKGNYLTLLSDQIDGVTINLDRDCIYFLTKNAKDGELLYIQFDKPKTRNIPFKYGDTIKVEFGTSFSDTIPAVIDKETTKFYVKSVGLKEIDSATLCTVEKPEEKSSQSKPAEANPEQANEQPQGK